VKIFRFIQQQRDVNYKDYYIIIQKNNLKRQFVIKEYIVYHQLESNIYLSIKNIRIRFILTQKKYFIYYNTLIPIHPF